MNTGHLFHSLYAYIPTATNVEKERKQIRLSEECIRKLFVATINDFKLYAELFHLIKTQKTKKICPCQLLLQRKNEISTHADTIGNKTFDSKPPKLKKEAIDNIMYKYSLNWRSVILKKKLADAKHKRKKNQSETKKIVKKRTVLTDELIYLENSNTKHKLYNINGLSLTACKHSFITVERQLRAGDEAVSFIKYCQYCNKLQN